jgi:hypothetical protein
VGYDHLQPHQEERQNYAERRDNRWLGIYSGGDVGIKHDHAARVAVKWKEKIETGRRSATFVQILNENFGGNRDTAIHIMGEPPRFHAGHVRQGAAPPAETRASDQLRRCRLAGGSTKRARNLRNKRTIANAFSLCIDRIDPTHRHWDSVQDGVGSATPAWSWDARRLTSHTRCSILVSHWIQEIACYIGA